jgi:hypothetical protein
VHDRRDGAVGARADVEQDVGRDGDAPPSQLTAVPKAAIQVVADSEETTAEDGRAANAIDDNPYTIWHTEYDGGVAPLPHQLTLDLGATYRLAGLRCLPRQDGGVDGRVADYEVAVSIDGTSWSTVASGQLVNDQAEKQIDFATTRARYLRFTALFEVNGNQYASLAELTPLQAPIR